jgi:hypothetical protein
MLRKRPTEGRVGSSCPSAAGVTLEQVEQVTALFALRG